MSNLKSTTAAVIWLVLTIGLVPLNTVSALPSNESGLSAFFAVPAAPTYVSPANGATGVSQSVELKWNYSAGATRYNIQVAKSSSFAASSIVFHTNLWGHTVIFNAPEAGATYYWRVNAYSPSGTSPWGATWSFTTKGAVTGVPFLYSPANGATGVPLSTDLNFSTISGARYNVQVSTSSAFAAGTIVYHANIPHPPAHFIAPYPGTFYWRVQAVVGTLAGKWTLPRHFTTVGVGGIPAVEAFSSRDASATLPESIVLHENYPNPFNPSTTIMIDVPEAGHIRLAVYDLLGHEVAELASGSVEAGRHSYSFDASGLPSGIYLYRLESAASIQTRQMMLLK